MSNQNDQTNRDEELIRHLEDDLGKNSARAIASEDHSDAEIESSVMAVSDEAPLSHDDDEDFGEPRGLDAEIVDEIEEEPRASTLSELFAGSESIRLRVIPRIMLNVTSDTADLPDVVRLGDSFYSVSSPLRKGEGKRKNPYGLIRDSLSELCEFVGTMSEREVVFFGPTNDTEDRVADLMKYVEEKANDIMYSAFPDPSNPVFRVKQEIPEPEEEEDEVEADENELDNIGVTEVSATSDVPQYVDVSASESFEVACWPVFDTDEDGTVILRPTIAVNVKMPLLVGASSIIKPISTMHKIVSTYTKAADLGEDDFRLTFAFDSEDLLDTTILGLLAHYAEDEESSSVIISRAYLEACARNLSDDPYRLFPLSRTAREAIDLLMPSGSDTLLLI